jgi:hypothetical protein
MVEVAVAAVAEAVAGHVDRRPEAPALEQGGQVAALGRAQQRLGHGEAAGVELLLEVVPGQRVDALLDARRRGFGDAHGASTTSRGVS